MKVELTGFSSGLILWSTESWSVLHERQFLIRTMNWPHELTPLFLPCSSLKGWAGLASTNRDNRDGEEVKHWC